jgi:myo-inositol-1(or 4)-monophosphatase
MKNNRNEVNLKFVRKLALAGGRLAMKYRKRLDTLDVRLKGEKDLVTEADKAVEKLLRKLITARYPGHAIVGEEETTRDGNDYTWSLDPIDGTVSFARGHNHFAVSVALKYKGDPLLGAVFVPALGEMYLAEKGKGATLNGRSIKVSTRSRLDDSILATGFACLRGQPVRNNIPYFVKVLPELLSIRRYGSAAYDLVMVASGRIEGFWELMLNPWDVDAGMLIVREAGGTVTDFSNGTGGLPGEILATNGHCHEALRSLLVSVDPQAGQPVR